MATFDEMMTFVRLQADADITDAPDSMLKVHARIAYNDILSRRSGWDHLEVKYTLTTVAGQAEYNLSGLSGGATMSRIYSITSAVPIVRRLTWITRSDAEIMFSVNAIAGEPIAYTLYNGKIVLYPTPSTSGRVLTVMGYRDAADWPTSVGSTPDLPTELHDAICWYMLSGYYLSQEDPQMAGTYLNEYQSQVDKFVKGLSAINQGPRPKVMGGSMSTYRSFKEQVKGMLE
jgi:hypothetical protein